VSTKTLTILFTDLANYTSSIRDKKRKEVRELIQQHEEMVCSTLIDKGGHLVKSIGDSYLFTFTSATDALNSGIDLINNLSTDDQMNIKIGIATGDVEDIDNDYFGDAVNMASRIVSMALPNEIWFSQSTFLSMKVSEVPFELIGLFDLKGFLGKHQLFRAVSKVQHELPEQLIKAATNRSLKIISQNDIPIIASKKVVLFIDFDDDEVLNQSISRLNPDYIESIWRLGYRLSASVRFKWESRGFNWLIGQKHSILQMLSEYEEITLYPESGQDTFIFDRKEGIHLLKNKHTSKVGINGLALLKTPVSDVVSSYFYQLSPTGEWKVKDNEALLRLDISDKGAQILSFGTNIYLNGKKCQPGISITISDGDEITYPNGKYIYHQLTSDLYLGYLLGKSLISMPLIAEKFTQIGRSPDEHGLKLFNQKGQLNLNWCVGKRALRAKDNGYNFDRSLVGRHQLSIRILGNNRFEVQQVHDICQSFLVINSKIDVITGRKELSQYDILLIGTNVITLEGVG
jgi:class 3 adenylate cyclase